MEPSFNGLTPAEAERLALLAEEAGEVVQAVCKILRHGYDSHHPARNTQNRYDLEKEIGDLSAAIRLCIAAGDLNPQILVSCADAKERNVQQYLHHQD